MCYNFIENPLPLIFLDSYQLSPSFQAIFYLFSVYNDLSIDITKSPPTRDKLQPENKAQIRSGRDATGTKNLNSPVF